MKLFKSRNLKLRLVASGLVTVSFLSTTFAWFAYSARSSLNTEVGVRSWYLELEKDGGVVSNSVDVYFDDLHPGMESVVETVKITNKGDSVADLNYSIKSARILDEEFILSDTVSSDYIEDVISNNYPFKIDMSLSKEFVHAGEDVAYYNIVVSWPMDSGNNELDGLWGSRAYKFLEEETNKKNNDSNYEIRHSIDLSLSLSAEQYIGNDIDEDVDFPVGKTILFNPSSNSVCNKVSTNCLITHVVDFENKVGDTHVNLLIDTTSDYRVVNFNGYNNALLGIKSLWSDSINIGGLSAINVLKHISEDVVNSKLVAPNLSDMIIGESNYLNRADEKLKSLPLLNGHYEFSNLSFDYLNSSNCYWTNTEYDSNRAYAVKRVDSNISKLYPEDKNTLCSIVPTISVSKDLLR